MNTARTLLISSALWGCSDTGVESDGLDWSLRRPLFLVQKVRTLARRQHEPTPLPPTVQYALFVQVPLQCVRLRLPASPSPS